MNPFSHFNRHRHGSHLFQRDDMFCGPSHRGGRGNGANPEGGRRNGRFFAHGGLRLALMTLIAEKPSHGYELIKAIEDKLDGAYSPSPGVVYPILTWIEDMGYATVQSQDDSRKLYALTDAGRTFLDENAEAVATVMTRMAHKAKHHHLDRPPQIVRAIENFKTALRLRMERQHLTAQETEAIAHILDEAAKAVERI